MISNNPFDIKTSCFVQQILFDCFISYNERINNICIKFKAIISNIYVIIFKSNEDKYLFRYLVQI